MAEATDRPQVPPDAVMPEEALSAPEPASSETYQPLSLLAMAGFGLSLIYALVVLIGAAVALLGHIPWLMPYWTFLIPLAVFVVCWAARTRILNSEGTLTGLGFTTWGVRLAVLISVTYAAYYFATFLAVRKPAINCANDFLQKIKDGRLDLAFLQSQDVKIKGKDKNILREEIEARFNQPAGMAAMIQPGAYSRFCQEHFVRYIEIDGDKAITTPSGVASWEFEKGGYRVVLNYHVATSLVEYDLKVDTFGRDPKPGEEKGTKWQVLLARSDTGIILGSMRYTDKGRDFEKKITNAQKCASDWVAKASDVNALKPDERESLSKLIRGYDTFWASKVLRGEISQCIRKTFAGGRKVNMHLQPKGLPIVRESDGRTTAWVETMLRYNEEGGVMPMYLVEARLVVSADSNAAMDSASAWRVDALQLDSGRLAPERRRMQKMAPPPIPGESGPGKGPTP